MNNFFKVSWTIILLLLISHNSFPQNNKPNTDWLFVYYMPYDNNLSKFGEEIIKMISDNVKSENVIVSIQAEFADKKGMFRYLITNNGITYSTINNEYSASINTYKEYITWVKDTVNYNKLAVIFLDHGGKLDEICLDEKPIKHFLMIDDIKSALESVFGKKAIDLLFLQVCTKGVIEALYEFKDTAKYTLCSQIELGAPNYYYPGLFTAFSNSAISTGYEAADLIVKNERNNMYNSLTLVDNTKFDNLFSLFSDLVNQIKNINISSNSLLTEKYYGELYWDVISILENIPNSESGRKLIEYIKNELILFHKITPRTFIREAMSKHSGLSISAEKNDKYNRLKFYELLKPVRDSVR